MRAEELRIGNLLEHDGIIREVSSLHSDNTLRFKDEDSSIGCFKATINTIQPIELTEEILLKCGFEKKFPFGYRMKQGCYIKDCLDIKGYYFRWNGQTLAIVDSLHQLQNLYFALTNQKLTINL